MIEEEINLILDFCKDIQEAETKQEAIELSRKLQDIFAEELFK